MTVLENFLQTGNRLIPDWKHYKLKVTYLHRALGVVGNAIHAAACQVIQKYPLPYQTTQRRLFNSSSPLLQKCCFFFSSVLCVAHFLCTIQCCWMIHNFIQIQGTRTVKCKWDLGHRKQINAWHWQNRGSRTTDVLLEYVIVSVCSVEISAIQIRGGIIHGKSAILYRYE